MKRIWGVMIVMCCIVCSARAQGVLQVQSVDGKLSIQAESVPLGRLLRLMDQATGMTSKVPPEMATRNVSVRFSGLGFDDAVKKVFEGQPIDYMVIQGQGIVVVALSQPRRDQPSSPVPAAPSFQPVPETPFVEETQPFVPPQQPMPGIPQPGGVFPGQMPPGAVVNPFNQQQPQPAVVQTPFGPIPNPRANQQGAPTPGAIPGQQNPFGGQQPPFGSVAPLGIQPQNQNPLFGNTSPPIMNTGPGTAPQQQRRP